MTFRIPHPRPTRVFWVVNPVLTLAGVEGVPAEWKDTLVEWARCEGLLKTLPALRAQLARDEL